MSENGKNLQQDLPLEWEDSAPPPKPANPSRAAEPKAANTGQPAPDDSRPTPEPPGTKPAGISPDNALPPDDSVAEPDSASCFTLPEHAESLGVTLLSARSDCGLTIAEVASRTRISADFIKTLETERYDELPSAVYTKSYIAKLCREYKIDPAPLIRSYQTIARQIAPADGVSGGQFVVAGSAGGDASSKVEYRLKARPEDGQGSGPIHPTMILVGALLAGLALLVLTALAVQQFRFRQASQQPAETTRLAEQGATEAPPATWPETIDLEPFIIPQQLPLKELPIPQD